MKEEYNTLVKKEAEAARHMDNNTEPVSKREKWVPSYKSIIDRLGAIIDELKAKGYEMTQDEIAKGFEV